MKDKGKSTKKKPQPPERNGQEWLQLHEKLRKERNRLRKELAEVKEERDYFRKLVGTLWAKYEPIEFDEEEVLAQMVRKDPGESIEDLLAEIEGQVRK